MQKAELFNLFDAYSNMVYRLAFSYLRNAHDARDAVQAVFMKFIKGKAQPIPGKERALLPQITVNYCKDALRPHGIHKSFAAIVHDVFCPKLMVIHFNIQLQAQHLNFC